MMDVISIDQSLCTRCGICSVICPVSIIRPADKNSLPEVKNENAGMCIWCGHCEVFCPSRALLLNDCQGEKVSPKPVYTEILSDDLTVYLKKRRSIRKFTKESVPREKILEILDIARYAASGGNRQQIEWMVVHDPDKVRSISGLTIEWMKTLVNTPHPMSGYVPRMIDGWERGFDSICQGAPHLLFAHIPEGNQVAFVDAIIALTHVDLAAPAFGVGTCWAGFVSGAAMYYEPLQKELGLPAGRKTAYALMLGYPKYKIFGIPRRKTLSITWR